MCRILIYGCPAVVGQISTNGAETFVTCSHIQQESKDTIKSEKFDGEIFVSHGEFPQFHKLIFVQTFKEEKPDVDNEPDLSEEMVEAFEMSETHLVVKDEEFPSSSFQESSQLDVKKEEQKSNVEVSPAGVPPYNCQKCEKILKTRATFLKHMKMHSKRFICSICTKGFDRDEQMQHHMLKHTGSKIYSCTHCEKSFDKQWKLTEHNFNHSNEKLFKCDQCDKTFRRRTGLKSHLFSHTDSRAFVCELCGNSFRRKPILRRHILTHSEVRAYKCTHCEKSFRTSNILQSHLATHQDVRQAYVCDICGKSLSTKSSLNVHKKSHRENRELFQCSICEKKFFSKAHRKRHIMLHMGESNHKCSYCDKTFVRKDHAEEHMALHLKYGDRKFNRKGKKQVQRVIDMC
ncbi:gastrula zinc finger protein XlCGF46.1-like [Lutzomyia longipalpis]|uniref:gastrula zinc finger protein XlCGF46.1-like n=1 Tax=Lutzomyia longipalpis TaxID=7200 RepID=UPI00248403F3|nr:gastrula zinc finger protein XlCGF46.1-like [Lutzomyia longipalpis]